MGSLICPACSTENPEGARFCMACGTALARTCPNCGAEALPGARFCVECGTSLADPAPTPAASPSPERPAQPPEERRRVAVLFADLSGYTAVAESMDPEALHGLVDRCLRRLGQEVVRYGGSVDDDHGQQLEVALGPPRAQADGALRPVPPAPGYLEAVGGVHLQPRGPLRAICAPCGGGRNDD